MELIKVIAETASISPDVKFLGDGKVIIEDYAVLEGHTELHATGQGLITIGSRAKVKGNCYLKCYGGSISIGHRTTIGEFSIISGHGGVNIGDYCMIAPYVMLNSASHILSGGDPYRFQGERTKGIKLHDNVWLGAKATVLDGVTIGQNVVVGAHSLVNRNVEDNITIAGIPAKPI